MSELAEKIARALFPEKSRRFLTFGWMTVFVAILILWNVAISFLFKPNAQPRPQWVASPIFWILYNTAVLIGFVVIYFSRKKSRYYVARAVFYGMLLAGVAGELLYFAQLHRHTISK